VLIKELGVTDAMRFLNQFQVGSGDYTREHEQLVKHDTFDSAVVISVTAAPGFDPNLVPRLLTAGEGAISQLPRINRSAFDFTLTLWMRVGLGAGIQAHQFESRPVRCHWHPSLIGPTGHQIR
jgi:hypothetical protein